MSKKLPEQYDGYIRKGWLYREIAYPLSNLHGEWNHPGWVYCDCKLAQVIRKLERSFMTKQKPNKSGKVRA